jgi:LPXTG-site transpeptidase (sortase) family protein
VLTPIYQKHEVQAKAVAAGNAAAARIASTQKKAPTPQAPPFLQGKPVRVVIPRIGLDVGVVDGVYYPASKVWSVAHDQANYATNTALINNKQGATLIYGHWYDWVFGKTRDLKAGDVAYVYTDTNHLFKYTYSGDTAVNPSDTEVFGQLPSEKGLVLMTCEGTWAQDRRLMTFNLATAV